MLDQSPHEDPERERPSGGRRPSPTTLLVAFLVMIALGYFLTAKLREMSRLQDCVMSGRTNCAPVSRAQ